MINLIYGPLEAEDRLGVEVKSMFSEVHALVLIYVN